MTDIKFRTFESQILYFNGMYKLPVAPYPTAYPVIQNEQAKNPKLKDQGDKSAILARLRGFKKTLMDEIHEVDEICRWLELGKKEVKDKEGNITGYIDYAEIEFLVDMADWLGDLQVYEASEMAKYGIPQKGTIDIIMSSNFSKQGSDGKPIYDEHGKVMKGPGYWKPEPQIKEMLLEKIADGRAALAEQKENGIVWRT